MTDRSGEKGDRDLLVALGLILVSRSRDLDELVELYGTLSAVERHAVKSALSTLSLLEPHAAMPDPTPHRRRIASLLAQLEAAE